MMDRDVDSISDKCNPENVGNHFKNITDSNQDFLTGNEKTYPLKYIGVHQRKGKWTVG